MAPLADAFAGQQHLPTCALGPTPPIHPAQPATHLLAQRQVHCLCHLAPHHLALRRAARQREAAQGPRQPVQRQQQVGLVAGAVGSLCGRGEEEA